MRYLYKIYVPFDGFHPRVVAQRLEDGRFLRLSWKQYLDAVALQDEVWIVFTGGRITPGVYVQGLVAQIDDVAGEVLLRVRNHDSVRPLSDPATSERARALVAKRGRQIFPWSADPNVDEICEVARCGLRRCRSCHLWRSLPRIDPAHYNAPKSLRGMSVIPAYWIMTARSYLYYNGNRPAPWINRVTDMFRAFKVGEARYAFPLAAGVAESLRAQGQDGFDAIVAVPLSPDKALAGEMDRTAELATELSRLTDVPVQTHLTLAGAISKRRMENQGFTSTEFQRRYRQLLVIDPAIALARKILLVDDVITRGTTLAVITSAIKTLAPNVEIVCAAAGQMVIKAAVADDRGPGW